MSAFIPWKDMQVAETACDKCGITIGNSPWLLTIDTWIQGDRWVYWEAGLCADCKEALVATIADFGVIFRYHRE